MVLDINLDGNQLPEDQARMVQDMMQPFLNPPRDSPLAQPIGHILSGNAQPRTFLGRVATSLSMQEMTNFWLGSHQILLPLHSRAQDILLSNYMNGEDTPDRRAQAAQTIADEFNPCFSVPEELKESISEGADPLATIRDVNTRNILSVVNVALDLEAVDSQSSEAAGNLVEIKAPFKSWIIEAVQELAQTLGGNDDLAIRFIQLNLDQNLRFASRNMPMAQIGNNMICNKLMNIVRAVYDDHKANTQQDEERKEATFEETTQELERELLGGQQQDEEAKGDPDNPVIKDEQPESERKPGS